MDCEELCGSWLIGWESVTCEAGHNISAGSQILAQPLWHKDSLGQEYYLHKHTHTKIDSSEGSKLTQTGHDSAGDTRGIQLGVMATGVRGERSVQHGGNDESVYCSEKWGGKIVCVWGKMGLIDTGSFPKPCCILPTYEADFQTEPHMWLTYWKTTS